MLYPSIIYTRCEPGLRIVVSKAKPVVFKLLDELSHSAAIRIADQMAER